MSSISIKPDNPTAAYSPGDSVSGTIEWENLDFGTETIEIRLLWVTQGKGNRDFEVVENATIESPRPSDQAVFNFTAPRYPNSMSGRLLSVVWMIEVIQFPDQQADHLEIVIGPGGKQLASHQITSSAHHSGASGE